MLSPGIVQEVCDIGAVVYVLWYCSEQRDYLLNFLHHFNLLPTSILSVQGCYTRAEQPPQRPPSEEACIFSSELDLQVALLLVRHLQRLRRWHHWTLKQLQP